MNAHVIGVAGLVLLVACGDGGGGPVDAARDMARADVPRAEASVPDAMGDRPGDVADAGRPDTVDAAPPDAPGDAPPARPWPMGAIAAPWALQGIERVPSSVDGGPVPSANMAGAVLGVEGRGAGLPFADADEVSYVFQRVSEDVEITARVESLRGCTSAEARAGVMIRQGVEANAAYVLSAAVARGAATVQYRSFAADLVRTLREEAGYGLPLWVRVARRGDAFTAAYSRDGVAWVTQGRTITMSDEVLVGLVVGAHDPQGSCGAIFTDVTVTTARHPDGGADTGADAEADAAAATDAAADIDAAAEADAAADTPAPSVDAEAHDG